MEVLRLRATDEQRVERKFCTTMENLIQIGNEFGLKGKELLDFVKDQLEAERPKVDEERQEGQREREIKKLVSEERERQRQREIEEKEREREAQAREKEAMRKHEREMRESELQQTANTRW